MRFVLSQKFSSGENLVQGDQKIGLLDHYFLKILAHAWNNIRSKHSYLVWAI